MGKKMSRLSILLLGTVVTGLLVFTPEAVPQVVIGKTYEEIVKLAAKEGKVRLGAGLSRSDAAVALKGFDQKYPMVKVDVTQTSGVRWGERVLNEALGGLYELDVYDVPAGMQARFVKAGIVAGPVEWPRLFPNVPEAHFSPNGYFTAMAFNLRIIAYNTSRVPPERVPKTWSDCLDPYWKGKVGVDTTPRFLTGLYTSWGEQRVLEFSAQLKNNQPFWQRGQTEALTQLAAGEFAVFCGAHYASMHRLLRRDPKAKLAMAIPEEVPVSLGQMLGVMKGAQSPNAAVLLAGWLASPDGGQKGIDQLGRGSPYVEGSEKSKLIKKAGAKTVFEGWDRSEYEPVIMKKVISALGFPVAK